MNEHPVTVLLRPLSDTHLSAGESAVMTADPDALPNTLADELSDELLETDELAGELLETDKLADNPEAESEESVPSITHDFRTQFDDALSNVKISVFCNVSELHSKPSTTT